MPLIIFKKNNQKGFTIIEVTVVVALSSVLLLGLFGIFDWQNKIYQLEQADVLATGSARVAMNNITKVIAQGVGIDSSVTIAGTNYTTGGSTVIVKIPSYDSSENLIDDTYDYIIFSSSGTNLNQVVELGDNSARKYNNKLLSDNIQTFTLTYNNADPTLASQVTVDITTKAYFRGSQSASAHLTETIFLRNR